MSKSVPMNKILKAVSLCKLNSSELIYSYQVLSWSFLSDCYFLLSY